MRFLDRSSRPRGSLWLIFILLMLKGYHKLVNACIYVWTFEPLKNTNWEVCVYTVAYTGVLRVGTDKRRKFNNDVVK